ncbi:MAG: hypothetical protein RL059_1345, partial [Bacteroidota bacterium]
MLSAQAAKKLFLLDAYALIYRAYFAFAKNPRINSRGENTSAAFGFTNVLIDVIKTEKPTHIAVVFDPPGGSTHRQEQFEAYKAHREEMPEDIRSMIIPIKRIVEAFNIPLLEIAGYEADDLIGALAKFKKKPSAKASDERDDFAAVIAALERNISKTYADKIVRIFKERLPIEIVLLEQSIEERDFKLMEERAHYQSGSMSSLHFKKGYQLAYAAERAATEQNADKAAEAANKLIAYLK